ncbi:hypothetical protein GP486_007408 [Trichoglossum hirsutum]|uniref:Uncharacterized protein n=1 Tax=Trichoglossum hirsutum TaxID=265104 RepID=A0A9P8II75_9PEZI|nr:hypothetical protein GP486_007408 [Trichoglossum hirsutum]
MPQQAHYQLFNHRHEDLVREVDFNLYGTRLVTASSDQRIKVYNKEKESGKWKLCDTWRAHDAEVNCFVRPAKGCYAVEKEGFSLSSFYSALL